MSKTINLEKKLPFISNEKCFFHCLFRHINFCHNTFWGKFADSRNFEFLKTLFEMKISQKLAEIFYWCGDFYFRYFN